MLQESGESGAEVVVLTFELIEPGRLLALVEERRGALSQRNEVIGMPVADLGVLV